MGRRRKTAATASPSTTDRDAVLYALKTGKQKKSRSSSSSSSPSSVAFIAKTMTCNTANDRERARMRVLSRAFGRLKDTLPWVPADTKLSKLDTLRMACYYIDHLAKVLDDEVVTTTTTSAAAAAMTAKRHRYDDDDDNEGGEDDDDIVSNGESDNFVEPVNLTWPFGFSSLLPASREIRSREGKKCRSRTPSYCDDSHASSG